MGETLGLDLGSNSIGWALIDEDNSRIIATGVRIFPEGVDRDQTGGELPKNANRRVARGMRRQIARRARRKKLLRAALIHAGLWPTDPEAQSALANLTPYELRRRGLDEPLTAHEFGRVLLHLSQRRGFLSNRKADRERKKESSEMLAEISDLETRIQQAGHRTLGEHLAASYSEDPHAPIRGQHTRREMLLGEFEALWAAQSAHHPHVLTEYLKYGEHGPCAYPREPRGTGGGAEELLRQFGLFGLVFFQRPIYWPKSVVGRCELDRTQKRCPRADRLAQRFRVLQEVNNLRIITSGGEIQELSADQRENLLSQLACKESVTFDEVRKRLGLLEHDGFNLEAGERRKLLGMATDAILASKKYYGPAWHALPEERKDEIVQALVVDREETFLRRAADEFGIEAEVADRMLHAPLPEGYASLGRSTIRALLPFIEQGLPLMSREGADCAVRLAGYLPPWERNIKQGQYLPEPPSITNPLVRQALYQVRKLVNAVIREYGRPAAIHIELAREVKGTSAQRRLMTSQMRARERRRESAAEKIKEHGEQPTRGRINRYLLWEEQSGICIYSGRPISIAQLFGVEVDIDHILPYSKSLDDSLMNKALCFRSENADKGHRTIYDWLAAMQPRKYEEVLQRAARLPREVRNRKRPKFSQKTCELTEFINRQLTDTAYITSAVVDYLRYLGVDVLGSKGQLTSELRHEWGLNEVLRDDGLNLKNREDHRHHAIDAIVVALTNRRRLQQLAQHGREPLPRPWDRFYEEAAAVVNEINVSHRVRRRVAGALHEETIYGPTAEPKVFVYRKPITALTAAMVPQIRDETIRNIVCERIRQFGIEPGSNQRIPTEVWKDTLCMPSGMPIKKVRLLKQDETIRALRTGTQYVKPGSNHHLCIFEINGSTDRARREAVWVSTYEAVQRIQRGDTIIQRAHATVADARFIMSISRGEMFLAEFKGQNRLVLFRTGASTQGQLYFVDHTDARPDKSIKKYVASANTLRAKKVAVDLLGRVRWAND